MSESNLNSECPIPVEKYFSRDKVPDRVIDAPIPDSTYEFFREDYERCQSGDKPKESSWACLFMDAVEAIKFLEAEKREARRIGLEFALHLANETADWCIEEQEKGYLGAMRVADAIKRELSRPAAAKQGEPS